MMNLKVYFKSNDEILSVRLDAPSVEVVLLEEGDNLLGIFSVTDMKHLFQYQHSIQKPHKWMGATGYDGTDVNSSFFPRWPLLEAGQACSEASGTSCQEKCRHGEAPLCPALAQIWRCHCCDADARVVSVFIHLYKYIYICIYLYYSKARAISQNNWGCKGLLEVIWTSGGPSGHVDLLKQDIWRCLTRTTRLLSLSACKSLEMSPGAITPQWLWEMKMEKSLRSSCWWLSGAGWLSKTTRLMCCPRGDEGWLSKEHMLPGLLTTRWLSAVQDLLLTSFPSKAMFVFPPSPSNL